MSLPKLDAWATAAIGINGAKMQNQPTKTLRRKARSRPVSRPYGTSVIRRVKTRKRKTPAEVRQLENEILEILESDHPQSVWHVFYRLTNPRLEVSIDKSERGYAQVQQRLAEMRRARLIPYYWISDSTRQGYHVDTFSDGGELIESFAGLEEVNDILEEA